MNPHCTDAIERPAGCVLPVGQNGKERGFSCHSDRGEGVVCLYPQPEKASCAGVLEWDGVEGCCVPTTSVTTATTTSCEYCGLG
ncbi:hypothetical protein Btru_076803 [Bulinus truncatus]|nr:hypothetical protein Btru_076803 [Bulinus truncatus]